jgi:SAM-dependent methyltransferase
MKPEVIQNEPIVQKLIAFIKSGGPAESDYDELTNIWNSLHFETDETNPGSVTRDKLVHLFGDEFLDETIQGFGYRKPHGYAGDFEIIDYIYQRKLTTDERFQKWDKYLHSQLACEAVRNRKAYFIQLVKEKCLVSKGPLRILNIASGPCRDILELFEQIPPDKLKIHCVEMDPNAIKYAKNLLGKFSEHVEFSQQNIFKFDTPGTYDLVWSAGLFDYFNDDDFTRLLSKVYSWCASSGETVVGNFSVINPSRSYMEKATNWYLFHRTKERMIELATKAGLRPEQIEVKSEVLGVNLFLHARHDDKGLSQKPKHA